MALATERATLTRTQKKVIKKYVDELVGKRMEILADYFDVDEGLTVRPEIAKRFSRTRRGGKRIAHTDFWSKLTKR
jgi:hypothetical protein